jgi:tRNA A-37 threonylcarbamoyl transferase component Bud32
MREGGRDWAEARGEGLRLRHRVGLEAAALLRAVAEHRANAARGREACEQWGPGSSVSRVRLAGPGEPLDLAVKWNHPRGLRRALAEALRGSRAARAAAGARRLRRAGLQAPETLAIAERRRLGGVVESFLVTAFLPDAEPLPAAMPGLREAPRQRRAVARGLGDTIGRLHAAGLDHRDLKHSNLLVRGDGSIVLLDLDCLEQRRRLSFRRRVRALGQLEAYAADLYAWLPRSDRVRFLDAYLRHAPQLVDQRPALAAAVAAWVERRLASWARKDRSDHYHFPLGPRRRGAAAACYDDDRR